VEHINIAKGFFLFVTVNNW